MKTSDCGNECEERQKNEIMVPRRERPKKEWLGGEWKNEMK